MQVLMDFGDYSDLELHYRQLLLPYVPQETIFYLCRYFSQKPVEVQITRSRKTKFGDFRPSLNEKLNKITINKDLNPYSFIITLIHEAAHLECWLKHKNKIKPHGKEWKMNFKTLMEPYIKLEIFPVDVVSALNNYLVNPAASSCSDMALMKALKAFNPVRDDVFFLEDIPENTIFMLNNNRIFQKGVKRRKLFKCKDLKNKRFYLINPLCEVKPINN
ncbi:MAG: SprT-like domain-containing protein [Bacteroidetes bacterium]|nr:SprT-like domain-containing protein [Bacteroidota bacterium]HET6245597.1 SprT-like domain-containing protein [Bacteroidia bacterium]